MKKLICFVFSLLIGVAGVFAQSKSAQGQLFTIKGTVTEFGTETPIEMATISLPEYGLWATTNSKGEFTIARVPKGSTNVKVMCLGYQTMEMPVQIQRNVENLQFRMREDNLSLSAVTVTAKENKNAATTSRTMEKQAIEHLQVVNATDILSLLPGGQTAKPSLTETSYFNLRGDVTNGFGTAVMMDGIRLSGNSSMKGIDPYMGNNVSGVDTRFIAASNIESVEVVTGVPSVEYGDMQTGMVIINTKKGRTPFTATVSLDSKTKQVAVTKGFELGKDKGIININAEYAKAFKNPVSRYTTYYRNNYGANYMKTFNKERRPVNLNVTLEGGWAEQKAKKDPDAYANTWSSMKQNNFRFGSSVKWLINAPWITSFEGKASLSFLDGIEKTNEFYSYATALPSYTSKQDGYYETGYLPSSFYYLTDDDSKALDMSAEIKATLNKKIGNVNNNIKIGFSWSNSSNVGDGVTYRVTDGTTGAVSTGLSKDGDRERPYSDTPALNNYSAYLEDVTTIPVGKGAITAVAGVRAEALHLKGMSYDNASAFSPRFNLKWRMMREKRTGFVRQFTLRGAWGNLTKLPTLGILYPIDNYRDILVYSQNYGTNNSVYYVSNTQVYKTQNNEKLKWASNRNIEVGFEANIGGIRMSAIYYNNKAKNSYMYSDDYVAYSYVKSDMQTAIPSNPKFRVDSSTGDIYVTDADNPSGGETLIPKSVLDTTFVKNTKADNMRPITTQGVELTFDLGTIKPIRTDVLVDASYSYTKNRDLKLNQEYRSGLSHSVLGASSGRSYQYVGYYVGEQGISRTYNGYWKDQFRANVTFVTHFPEIRLTISTRIEAQFYNRSRNITYYNGKEWAYLMDDAGNKVSGSVYHQKEYATGAWPVAYKTFDGTVRPFTQEQADDPAFSSLISTTTSRTAYITDGNGPYFSANISITKEIGKIASISFYANNCTNSIHKVRNWATGYYMAKYATFTYGATLRLKF